MKKQRKFLNKLVKKEDCRGREKYRKIKIPVLNFMNTKLPVEKLKRCDRRIDLNPLNPGPDVIFMAQTLGMWPKPEIVQHATFAILHLCVAIAICSSYHVMIPFMDSIKMPHDIRYTLI